MKSKHTFTHTFTSCHMAQKSNQKNLIHHMNSTVSTVPRLPYVLVWKERPWEPEGSAAHHLSV